MQPRFVQFVNHETNDSIVVLSDHADAVALPQAAEKIFFAPGKFETLVFNRQHLRHVATDHPANVYL